MSGNVRFSVLLSKPCMGMSSETDTVSPTFTSICGAATHTSSFPPVRRM